jgi:3-dehydroquinate dehydratase
MKDFQEQNQFDDHNPQWNQWAKYVLMTISQIIKTQEKQEEALNELKLEFEKFKSNLEGKVVATIAVASVAMNIIFYLVKKYIEK